MKKLLLTIILMVNGVLCYSQISFSSFSTSNITYNSASLNAYVTINCANGGNFHAQYSTSPSFTSPINAPGGSAFVSYARTINIANLAPETTYYWRYYGNLGTNCNPTIIYSATQSFTTSAAPTVLVPTITNISVSSIGATTATINYSVNANYGPTTTVVKYGTSYIGGFANEIPGISANGATETPTAFPISGLLPNTVYYFLIEATNSAGTTTANGSVGYFTTAAPIVPQIIAEYNFNNTYTDVSGNTPFATTSGTFTTDRNNIANNALTISNTGAIATITNLPYGASARTVSIWVKMNSINTNFNFIYNYGASSGYYGAYFGASMLYHFASGSSHATASTTSANEWAHFVFSYDGAISKIYKNGMLINSSSKTWNTINSNNRFGLGLTEGYGEGYFNGAVDDLKIYNYAISDADVQSLFTNNTLASQEFNLQNLQATLYPNPTNDAFTIEMETELKSIEIYSLQGQKVMNSTSKSINVSGLSKGIYLVQIEDENNAMATQKLIVK